MNKVEHLAEPVVFLRSWGDQTSAERRGIIWLLSGEQTTIFTFICFDRKPPVSCEYVPCPFLSLVLSPLIHSTYLLSFHQLPPFVHHISLAQLLCLSNFIQPTAASPTRTFVKSGLISIVKPSLAALVCCAGEGKDVSDMVLYFVQVI